MLQKYKEKIASMHIVQNFRKMYPYIKPYLFRAVAAIVITIPIGSMDAVIAWVLKPYMDTVMIQKSVQSTSFFPLLIVLFSLLQSLLNYLCTYLNAWVGSRITVDLKCALFERLVHSEASFFDKNTSGEILYRYNFDVDSACNGLLANIKLFTTRIFSSVSLIFVLFYNSWQLAIIAIVVLAVALYPLSTLRKKIKSIFEKTLTSGSRVLTHYNEAFAGNRVITSYNLHDYQAERFKETLFDVFRLGMRMTKRTGMMSPLMHFIVSVGVAGVIWLGSYLIVHDHLTAGGFVSFVTALLMLYQPIKSMGSNFTNVQMSVMAMERVFDLAEREPLVKSKPDAPKLEHVEKSIEYKDVYFEYVANKPVLKNINLSINVGQTVAFVGNSGGGKTTLLNLLPRFYDVKSGSIQIDGVDITELDLNSLRDKIAVVFQDNFLFDGTIRQNIVLGNKDVTEQQLNDVIKHACLDEFIYSLTNGVDTEIGERGILLSGGQKQRIAIARAFIKNAPIVILDEATSALDNKSEAIVQQAIYNLMSERTVFVIAHRLSTVKHADKIVVVNDGVIAEVGTHEELVNNSESLYASLYKTQLS